MISREELKFGVFLVLIVAGTVAAALGLSFLTQVVTAFQQGADPASIYRGHSLVIPTEDEGHWISLRGHNGTLPSQAEQEEILSSYWMAWEALSRAQLTGDSSDMTTYWAGSAYEQALLSLVSEQRLSTDHWGHKLNLTFFSRDHSVVRFEDVAFTMEQTIEDSIVSVQVSATVVMTLDLGFWRIRSLILTYHDTTS